MKKYALLFGSMGFTIGILAPMFCKYHWTFSALAIVSAIAIIGIYHRDISENWNDISED